MAEIHPLRALRYTPAAGDLADLATLPYDVIPAELEAQYKARSPHNFAHLILPRGDYAGAAEKLAAWQAAGVLARDNDDALYVYEQTFPAPGTGELLTRRGFIGLGPAEDYGKNVFRHEWTMSGPREDRYQLLRHTRVQFDSIFMLYSDAAGQLEPLLDAASARPTDVAYSDHEQTAHRLWRVTDAAWIAAVQQAMAAKPLLIADGHHRYETALRMGQSRVLMTFVSLDAPGLRCFATHRVVHSLEEFDAAAFLAMLPNVSPGLDLRSPAGHTRIGVVLPGGIYQSDIPSPEGALNVAVLQDKVLTPLLALTPERVTAGGRLRYKRSQAEAVAEVREGRAQVAFLLEDLPINGMARVSFAGTVLPQKSTFFYPKLGSGLVMYPLD